MNVHRIDKIIFHIREKDIVLGSLFIYKNSSAAKLIHQATILTSIFLPCSIFVLGGEFTSINFIALLIEMPILYLFFISTRLCFIPLFFWFYAKILKKTSKGILGEHKIYITEEELIETTSVNESHVKWSGIEDVYRNKNYIFIILTDTHQGYIIPQRAFAKVDDANQFYDLASSFYKNSRAA